MRHAVLAVAILGALAPGAISIYWAVTQGSNKEALDANRVAAKIGLLDVDKFNHDQEMIYTRGRVWPLLLGTALLAIAAGGVAELRHGASAAALLFSAVLGPALVLPFSLCMTFPLIVAFGLAFFVRQPAPKEPDEDEDESEKEESKEDEPEDD